MVLLLLKQIMSMMIMVLCGAVLVRAGVLKAEDSGVLSSVTIYLVLPCVVINSFQIEITQTVRLSFLTAVLAAVLYHFLLLLVCRLIRKPLRLGPVEEASVYYSNSANMIMPLVAAVLGKDMVLYASAFFCVQNFFTWTHGLALISGKASTDLRRFFKNPNLIAVGIGLVMFMTGLRLPGLLRLPMESIASIVGPVSMLTIGMILTRVRWGAILDNGRLFLVTALRLLIIPAATLLVLAACSRLFPQAADKDILLVSYMAVIAPTATSVMQMANLYQREEVYAGMLCAMTTVCCAVTMPVMVALYLMVM